jgi:hypothetical protein
MRLPALAVTVLLCLLLILAGGSALRESATVDEISHIGSGLSYLQKLDLRLNPEHPPLAKAIAAIPLAVRRTTADYDGPAWKAAGEFFPAFFCQWTFGESVAGLWNPWRPVVLWARAPMMLLTLLLGWIVYTYAARFGGWKGGLLSLALYISTPAVLVFGPLVLTDIPVTLFTVVAIWQLGELWNRPTGRNSLFFALACAGALLSKFTGLFLFPITLLLFAQTRFFPTLVEPTDVQHRKAWRRSRWRAAFRSAVWTLALVYLFYLILSWNQSDEALSYLKAGPLTHVLRRILMPPWLYLRGILFMLITSSRSMYLFGKTYPHGEPFYFPVVFALKSTLGFLALLVMGAVAVAVSHSRRKAGDIRSVIPAEYRSHWRIMLISLWFFVGACLLSRLDISIRHFLVPVVMLIVLLAPLPNLLGAMAHGRTWSYVAAGLACFSVLAVIRQYPHYFPYVNELALGRPAFELLNDSNVSWNGALPEVEMFAQGHRLQRVNFDWAAAANPSAVVPEARTWDCQAPNREDAGQWSVVAAVSILENHNCGWLLRYPREAIAGGEMYAFLLPPQIPAAGSPGGPPVPSQCRLMWGIPFDFRALVLDLDEHPAKIPETIREMTARMQSQGQSKAP